MCCSFCFLMDSWGTSWKRAFTRLLLRIQSWHLIFSAMEIEFYSTARLEGPKSEGFGIVKCRKIRSCTSANGTFYVVKAKDEEKSRGNVAHVESQKSPNVADAQISPRKISSNGGRSKVASLFTQQGGKGLNQDAMLVVENFTGQADTVFCGVFDGHGPDGHFVAREVRDNLYQKLESCWQSFHHAYKESLLSSDDSEGDSVSSPPLSCFLGDPSSDPNLITTWKESFVEAFKLMDRDLLVQDYFDCVSSGTTAITLVKQGNDLIVGNIGDSRAVLGTRADDNSLLALQLSVDLKPNVPREAERIRQHKGRVFALRNEPSVKRVWLPHKNSPGLAMARAFGDYCLKNYGVISEPEVTYRRLTSKDEFIVLATDGVWDVLSNEQVINIVASVSNRSLASKAIVDTAANVWSTKHATSKVDDCAVVCLFLKDSTVVSS